MLEVGGALPSCCFFFILMLAAEPFDTVFRYLMIIKFDPVVLLEKKTRELNFGNMLNFMHYT
jgi:hypothetical protein